MPIIREIKGDILKSEMETVVCTVNLEGAMGAGVALYMAENIPGLLKAYREACKTRGVCLGKNWMYEAKPHRVYCMATKDKWRYNSRYEYVVRALYTLVDDVEDLRIQSLAIPRLGCGNGKLDWEEYIKPMMYQYLNPLKIPVEIYL